MAGLRSEPEFDTTSDDPGDRPPGRVARTIERVVVHAAHLASCFLGDDVLGRRLRVALLRAAGADIARGASLHGGTYVSRPRNLVVGPDTFVNRNCYLDLESRLVLGARVTIGHGTTFVTSRHAMGPHEQRCGEHGGAAISVGDGAWLGANVTVMPGLTIGSGAVVAAGSVVLHDVPPDVLVAGVPARRHKVLPTLPTLPSVGTGGRPQQT